MLQDQPILISNNSVELAAIIRILSPLILRMQYLSVSLSFQFLSPKNWDEMDKISSWAIPSCSPATIFLLVDHQTGWKEEDRGRESTNLPFWAIFPRRVRSSPPCGRARCSTAPCSVSDVVCADDGDGGGVGSEAEIADAFLCGQDEEDSLKTEREKN